MKIKAIITGATGMVGEGVLHQVLEHPEVEAVLVVGRRSCGVSHPKLKEIIHKDFLNLEPITHQLTGYNACFFCLGVSAVGMSKEEYFKMTYTLTMCFGRVLAKQNPDMTFCYVSGAGTSNDVNKGANWARVKGKTEQDLARLPFKEVYAFRPGFMRPAKEAHNVLPYYKYFDWLYPVVRMFGWANTLKEVGQAMVTVAQKGYAKPVVEIKDIRILAE